MNIKKDFSLKYHNTFGVDVKSKYFAVVDNEQELIDLLKDDVYSSLNKLFIGGGSNQLFTKDFDGIVIQLNNNSIEVISENDDSIEIKVDAGVCWDDFVKYTVERDYYGIENLSLIPGNVGAAPIQNIGAYGTEVKNVIKNVNCILLESLEKKVFSNNNCKFEYRNSIFKNELKNKVIISSVVFNLSKIKKLNLEYAPLKKIFAQKKYSEITIEDVRNAVISIRKSKLPDPNKIGNAGSFFKNPIITKKHYEQLKNEYEDLKGFSQSSTHVKISAGWLIEKCGIKGKRIGDVGIHERQALVIVNYGKASGKEIMDFSNIIVNEVINKFDISLTKEVNII